MVDKEKYAFIIGTGDLPKRIINAAEKSKIDFIVAGIRGVSEKYLVNKYDHFWFYLGEIQLLINSLKSKGVTKVILAGAVKRPSLWSIRIDALGRDLIKKYLLGNANGDNDLLAKIISIFEDQGFKVGSPQDIDGEILAEEKIYTQVNISDSMLGCCHKGFQIAKDISQLDIGQSIIIQQNMVVAVEAVEGTAEMILRSKHLLKKNGNKGILVKVRKKYQETRVDLPTIGDKTIKQVKKAGLAGIVIEANNTIILNQEETIRLANKYNIFLMAIKA